MIASRNNPAVLKKTLEPDLNPDALRDLYEAGMAVVTGDPEYDRRAFHRALNRLRDALEKAEGR